MATKTKAKKSKRKSTASKEKRVPKILGILCCLIGLYLLLAFTSYIFTWKADQDQVLRLSWSILFDNTVSVDNWLGRFGAVVSNLFFYWGFGIASYLVIPMVGRLGFNLIKRQPILSSLLYFQKIFLVMCFAAILAAFLFQHSSFPWGGSFGSNICYWMTNFVGQIGLTIMLIFSVIGWLVWKFNPSFESIELATPGGNFQMPSFLKFEGLPSIFAEREETFEETLKEKPKTKRTPKAKEKVDSEPKLNTLRPRSAEDDLFEDFEVSPTTDLSTHPSTPVQERSGELELELPDTMIGEPSAAVSEPFEKIELQEFGVKPNKNRAQIETRVQESSLEIAPEGERIKQEMSI